MDDLFFPDLGCSRVNIAVSRARDPGTGARIKRSRSTKHRRTKAAIQIVKDSIFATLNAENPMTVRQLFYRMVSSGAIDKTQDEYKVVVRLVTEMRLAYELPFEWIVDNTRWQRKAATYASVDEAMRDMAASYRRDLWANQPAYCEIWSEKDAVSGVIGEETDPWAVPLMICRGYPSLTFLHEAAMAIMAVDKPIYLYYFGDYDPSGLDITRNIEERINDFALGADIHFERVAVTPEQIKTWNLPTRPTKKTDSRSKNFDDDSVEVDAIPPSQLRELVRNCITQHIDQHALEITRVAEESERQGLMRMAEMGLFKVKRKNGGA